MNVFSFGPHDSKLITSILEKIKSKTDTQAELNDLLAYTGKYNLQYFLHKQKKFISIF